MGALKTPTEAEILEDMVRPGDANMPPEAAHALQQLSFDAASKKAITSLLRANAKGTITGEGRVLLDR